MVTILWPFACIALWAFELHFGLETKSLFGNDTFWLKREMHGYWERQAIFLDYKGSMNLVNICSYIKSELISMASNLEMWITEQYKEINIDMIIVQERCQPKASFSWWNEW